MGGDRFGGHPVQRYSGPVEAHVTSVQRDVSRVGRPRGGGVAEQPHRSSSIVTSTARDAVAAAVHRQVRSYTYVGRWVTEKLGYRKSYSAVDLLRRRYPVGDGMAVARLVSGVTSDRSGRKAVGARPRTGHSRRTDLRRRTRRVPSESRSVPASARCCAGSSPRPCPADRHRLPAGDRLPAGGTVGRTVAVPIEVVELLHPVVATQRDPAGLLWTRPSDGGPNPAVDHDSPGPPGRQRMENPSPALQVRGPVVELPGIEPGKPASP